MLRLIAEKAIEQETRKEILEISQWLTILNARSREYHETRNHTSDISTLIHNIFQVSYERGRRSDYTSTTDLA